MTTTTPILKEQGTCVPNQHVPLWRAVWPEQRNRISRLARLVIVMMFVSLGVSAACGGTGNEKSPAPTVSPATTLTIAGAGGTTRVLNYLAEAYGQQHDDLAFKFLAGSGSSGGVKGVIGGQFHLGAMSRSPKEKELAAGIKYLNFAQDRVAVVTSPDLSIGNLTSQQVKDIFLGVITRWSEVGGPEMRIDVLVREEKDSNTKIMRKGIIGDGPFAAGAVTMTSEDETKVAMVAATNTISYVAYSGVRIEQLPLHALALDGQDPADPNSAYPLESRPLGVSYLPEHFAKIKTFLDFMTIPETQELLADLGIGPVENRAEAKN